MKANLPSARVKGAPPEGNCGGGAYSSAISKHKYASTPPSKRGTKIRRDVGDQFCTHRNCSEPRPYVIQTSKLESGYSTTKAREKSVLVSYRKSQRDMRRCESWGVPLATNATKASLRLDEDKAKSVLRKIALKKCLAREAEAGRREAERKALLRKINVNVAPSKINGLGNAFAMAGL